MILQPEAWPLLWEAVEEEIQQSNEKSILLLFSVHEVETVCAVKMLQRGLDTRGIHFSSYPVDGYDEVAATLDALLSDSDAIRTILLVNCGAGVFVRDLAPPSAQNVRFIVIDSHRPVAPAYNDPADDDVMLMLADDDPLPAEAVPPASALDELSQQEREQLLEAAREEAEAEAAEDDEDDDSPAKRQRLEGQRDPRFHRDKLAALRARERLLAEYHGMGSSYGKPSPLLVMPLAEQLLGRLDNTLLWPAAIGLTDQWVHQRLSSRSYAAWFSWLADRVAACGCNGGGGAHDNNRPGGRGPAASGTAVLRVERDYRLMLWRHWTLFDAFVFSPYVAPRLQTWRAGGTEALALLFAHMGISLSQAKTQYSSMQAAPKRCFHEKLQAAVATTNLAWGELACEGFALHHSRQQTPASDVVHALTALLSEHTLAESAARGQVASGFWAAVQAVDCHTTGGWQQLKRGLEMAKVMQQAIVNDGGLMVSDRKLAANSASHMQELNLDVMQPANAREFRHPLTLLRLASFVRDATRVARAGSARSTNWPILVVGPASGDGECLVIGLRAKELPDGAQYNVFGSVFAAVLEHPDNLTEARSARGSFDRAVLRLPREAVANFVLDVRGALQDAAKEAEEALRQEQAQQQQQQQQQAAAQQQQQQQQQQGWQRPPRPLPAGGRQQPPQQQRGEGGGDDQQQQPQPQQQQLLQDQLSQGEAELLAPSDDGGDDGGGGVPEVVMGSDEEEEQLAVPGDEAGDE